MRLICLLCTALTISCSGRPPGGDLLISNEFSAARVRLMQAAAQEWFDAIPEAQRCVRVANPGERVIVYSTEAFADDGTRGEAQRFTRIVMLRTLDDELFRVVFLHEMGHYLGLRGHTEDGIMRAYDLTADDVITASDVEAVRTAFLDAADGMPDDDQKYETTSTTPSAPDPPAPPEVPPPPPPPPPP